MIEKKKEVFQLFMKSSYDDVSVFLLDAKSNISLTIEEIKEYNRVKELMERIKVNTQPVKNQHYVPQFYLKLFTNSEGRVETFDRDRKKIMKSQDTKSICSDTYFYALETGKADLVSQILEEFFKGYEDRFAAIYEKLVNNILLYKDIDDEDLYELCVFVIVSFLRSKYFRDQLNESHAQLETKISSDMYKMHESAYLNDPELQGIISDQTSENTTIGSDYDSIINNEHHIAFMGDESKIKGFANLLFKKKVRIYITNGERNFITSDCCIIEMFPERRTVFGIDFMSRFHYFALSPKILIEFSDPSQPGKKLKREKVGKTEVLYYNLLRTMYSKYLYSISKDDFVEKEYEEACILYMDRLATLFPSEFLEVKGKIDELKKHTKAFGLPYTNEYIIKNIIPHLIKGKDNGDS